MFVLALLVGVVGITTALQSSSWEAQWGPNLIGGKLDFRFPDWVVNPRPPCVQEGVFPHPRSHNCTWYYRCVPRIGRPMFATFYFQCEPGTMFEDDLDQCVHPHSDTNCQASSPPTPVTQPPDFCSPHRPSCCQSGMTHLCRQKQCTISGVRDYCFAGQLYDTYNLRCVNTPVTSSPVCEVAHDSCRQVEVCTGTSRYVQNLCERERCVRTDECGSKNSFERIMCSPGQLFDTDQRACVRQPPADTCSCEYTKTECRNYDLCNPSGVRYLCECHGCGPGMMYDPNTRVCIAKTVLCPVMECVFRDSVCKCLNGKSLCTGCFMRKDHFIHASEFCEDLPVNFAFNKIFYHVEKDTCLFQDPGIQYATSGNCPRTRDSLGSLQCALRDNSVIRCWADDDMN